jgi:monothiol glutaredoxin
VKNEFIGGCDITREMFQSGELVQLFDKEGVPHAQAGKA